MNNVREEAQGFADALTTSAAEVTKVSEYFGGLVSTIPIFKSQIIIPFHQNINRPQMLQTNALFLIVIFYYMMI